MQRFAISLRVVVLVLVAGVMLVTGRDIVRGQTLPTGLLADNIFLTTPDSTGGFRDIHTQGNIGGIRIYNQDPVLTVNPTGAALQFWANNSDLPGQAFIDAGKHNSGAIIFRTATTSPDVPITERMRISSAGNVGIGTNNPTLGKLEIGGTSGNGIYSVSAGSGTGVHGQSVNGIGVSGVSSSGNGIVAASQYGFAGLFNGIVRVTGQIQDGSGACLINTCPSDARFKTDVTPVGSLLAKLTALQPVTFRWRTDAFPERHFSSDPAIGLIAQDVEQVFPELVTEDEQGYKGVRYEQLPVLLLEGMKELKSENDALRQTNAQLQEQNAEIEQRLAILEQKLNGGLVATVAAR